MLQFELTHVYNLNRRMLQFESTHVYNLNRHMYTILFESTHVYNLKVTNLALGGEKGGGIRMKTRFTKPPRKQTK